MSKRRINRYKVKIFAVLIRHHSDTSKLWYVIRLKIRLIFHLLVSCLWWFDVLLSLVVLIKLLSYAGPTGIGDHVWVQPLMW